MTSAAIDAARLLGRIRELGEIGRVAASLAAAGQTCPDRARRAGASEPTKRRSRA
jgi:hypothetical protein